MKKLLSRLGSTSKGEDRLEYYKSIYPDLVEAYEKGEPGYETWIMGKEIRCSHDIGLSSYPLISVILIDYTEQESRFDACIQALQQQTYEKWELLYATDSVNDALEKATGEYVVFLEYTDLLAPWALLEMVAKACGKKLADLVYGDEDQMDVDNSHRHDPFFKPDWSPDTLLSLPYIGNVWMCRTALAKQLGGLRQEYGSAMKYDFLLRLTERTNHIEHVPQILAHKMLGEDGEQNFGQQKNCELPRIYHNEVTEYDRAREDALIRRGIQADIESVIGSNRGRGRVVYKPIGQPLVSVIIPSKDNYDVLKRCIDSLYQITSYSNFETILVDNGSSAENRDRYAALAEKYNFTYHYEPMDFHFARMCNIGAVQAHGQFLLFLNDDTQIIQENWMSRMLGQAQQDHTGAVGAKLLYPDHQGIQHCGVAVIEAGPCHVFSGYNDDVSYYFGRNKLDYNYLAVTAACLMVSREKYNVVGGFDESFVISYNDIDFCMRLAEQGWFNVVRNDVTLIHYESVSRGVDAVSSEKTERLKQERSRLCELHPQYMNRDPFYNSNLTWDQKDFSIGINQIHMKLQPLSFGLGRESRHMQISFDEIRKQDNLLYVGGWAFDRKLEDNNGALLCCLVRDADGQIYQCDTHRMYRPDVSDVFPQMSNIEFCGFRTVFCLDGMKTEDLVIGIQIEDKVCFRSNHGKK